MGLGVAALVTVGGGYAYQQWQSNNSGTTDTSTAKSDATAKSDPTDIPTANSDATVKSSPREIPTANSDATVKSSPREIPTANSDATVKSSPREIPTANSDATIKSSPTDIPTANSDATIKSSPTDIPTANPDLTQPLRDKGSRILARARDKAKSGDFQGAIALAEQVSSSSSVYDRAQNAIARWQERQQQTLGRQQSENRARSLLANAEDVAKRGEDGDIETAIGIAQEAMAEVPPNSSVYKKAQSAIAQWQREATAKRQQEAASSYACSCQLNNSDDQKAATYKESPNDLTGSDCAAPGEAEERAIGVWKCEKR
jgi:hypothetical protein